MNILNAQKSDRIVVATGAKPIIPPITGVNRSMVTSAVDLLNGKSNCGESAVIIGGGLVGCEIAIWLSQLGKKTTFVEMLSDVMTGNVFVPHQVRMMTSIC